MAIGEQSGTPVAGPKRRVVAAILSPLGVAPFMAFSAWEGMEMSSESPVATLWDYLWRGVLAAYLLAAPAGVIAWWLLKTTKKRPGAGLIILLFMAASAVTGVIFTKSLSGIIAGVMFGLPTAITYCLIAGVPWRSKTPPSDVDTQSQF